MITIFRRIKSDLKEMYDLLQKNPDQDRHIKKDMLIAQQLISDSLKKVKRNIAYEENTDQGSLFNQGG
jgi:hypothetical protein